MTAVDDARDPRLRGLGEYIRLQRQMADLSLRRLAELTDVSNAYLSQIERGLHEPSLRVLRAIAGALNMSAATLLAQAGMVDAASATVDGRPRTDTETAIREDPDLAAEEKEALLAVYRSFRQNSRFAADSAKSSDAFHNGADSA
jgi:transcriptional regulator with XRE-family HTH domain